MKFRLPSLVHGNIGALLYFVYGAAATLLLYQVTNRMHLFEPNYLSMSAVDQALPLIPWTIWIYFTEYVIFVVSWLWLADDLERTKYWYSYMAILLISVAVFIVWPTTFPRADFPLTDFEPDFHVRSFEFFRANMDTPANCVPSLHVSSCYIASLVFWRVSKPKFWFFFIWATIVSVSTMTTKQHYFIDVWTAMILTGAVYYFFYNHVDYAKRA